MNRTQALARIGDMIRLAHNPALAQQEGHVYQIWDDGEITSQKAGALLNQRILHMLVPGYTQSRLPVSMFPVVNTLGNAYAFVTHEDAKAIHEAMGEFFNMPEEV